MIDLQAEKKKLRKERKKRRKAQERCGIAETPNRRWLSNANADDSHKIRRAFPSIVEGLPRATGPWSVEDQHAEGLVGLYLAGEDEEACSDKEG